MIQTYKFTHNIWNVDDDLFTLNVDSGTRGHQFKLYKERLETIVRGHFLTNRATDLWNSLPRDVVNASSVNQFKNMLDSYWEDKDWLYDYEAE